MNNAKISIKHIQTPKMASKYPFSVITWFLRKENKKQIQSFSRNSTQSKRNYLKKPPGFWEKNNTTTFTSILS
jgi:hypothetical protein